MRQSGRQRQGPDRQVHALEAAARGELEPRDIIVETTSGNTGIALAWVARALGHRVIIFMPEHMSVERRRMLERLGAEVRLTPKGSASKGRCAARRLPRPAGLLRARPVREPGQHPLPRDDDGRRADRAAARAGCKRLDYFVAGVGTGGTLMGVGQALRAAMPEVRVVAVEPAESRS